MLTLSGVGFSWDKPVLSGVSARFGKEEKCRIMGPNGSGKTTLLRIVSGVLVPREGRVEWDGGRRPRIGWLGASGFYIRLTAWQNMEYFGAFLGVDRRALRGAIQDPFGIDFWHRPVEELSLGMAQKLRWVRAFLGQPEVLLLDEPFQGLDQESQASARRAITEFPGLVLLAHHGGDVGQSRSLRMDGGRLHDVADA